jgi:hypothetical protein
MTTKSDKIAALKLTYPTLRIGDDERGYEDLSAAEYEATILMWADNELAQEAETTKAAADKAALLAKMGLTADEAKLLLS